METLSLSVNIANVSVLALWAIIMLLAVFVTGSALEDIFVNCPEIIEEEYEVPEIFDRWVYETYYKSYVMTELFWTVHSHPYCGYRGVSDWNRYGSPMCNDDELVFCPDCADECRAWNKN